MKRIMPIIAASLFVAAGSIAYGQDQNASDKYVTKEEYQKLKQELEALKAQIQRQQIPPAAQVNAPAADTQALKARVEQLEKKQAQQQTDTDQSLDQMDKDLKNFAQKTKAAIPGSTHMLIGGYGSGTFQANRGGYGPSQAPQDTTAPPRAGNSFFTATFNPIFLWQISDRLLFEGELELELASADSSQGVPTGATTALEMAQMSYLINDYMTLGAGKFLNPMDYFVERQHMAWVNKLPDKPLAVYDGFLPETLLGVQLRGGVPVGPTKVSYALYVANAPMLNTSTGNPGYPVELGTLAGDDFDNTFGHIATGGRLGFSPIPELELGYGVQVSAVGPRGSGLGSLLQSADLTYVRDSALLKGTINFHAQWVWSHIDANSAWTDTSVNPAVPLVLPFNNNRNGGYVQLAYRPSKVTGFIKNFEPVIRYDMINQINTPIGFNERRWTAGLNYWLGPSTVVKVAYEIDHQKGIGQSGDAFIVQFAIGF